MHNLLQLWQKRALPRDKADALLLLAACTLVLLPHFAQLPLAASSAISALLLWRGWITYAGHRLPPRWLLIPIAALTMAGVWLAYRTFFGRDAGVAMLTLLLALKLLEMHARRDLFVVLFLSFFVLLTRFFYSQTIATALLTSASVVLLLTAQQSFQYTGLVPPLGRRLAAAATAVGMALPLMLVMFVLFPRVQGPLWGLPGDANGARSGLSDSMRPGQIADLAQSDEIAFRVKFDGPVPPQSALYWRAAVFGNFDGLTWTQQPQRALPEGALQVPVNASLTHYQVTLEPHGRRWLFALEVPVVLPKIGGADSFLSDDFQLLTGRPVTTRLRYEVASSTRFELAPDATEIELALSRRLPTGFNPASGVLARQLRRQSDDPQALANTVLRYFRTQPFSYTLTPPLLGRNAVDEFLLGTRAGFCEHYAAAFVVLMREMGVPARVVTGYQGGELNPVDGYLEIRQSDAHAWAEIWTQGRGWVRFDPTAAVAPERVQHSEIGHAARTLFGGLVHLSGARSSWLSAVRLSWDAVSNAWNQTVLNYSADRQKSLLSRLGLGEFDWAKLVLLMAAIGSVVVAVTVLPLLIQRERVDPVQAVYRQFCRRMAHLGIARARHQGPRGFSETICAHVTLDAEKKAAAAQFLRCYETLQYGTVGSQQQAIMLQQIRTQFHAFNALCR